MITSESKDSQFFTPSPPQKVWVAIVFPVKSNTSLNFILYLKRHLIFLSILKIIPWFIYLLLIPFASTFLSFPFLVCVSEFEGFCKTFLISCKTEQKSLIFMRAYYSRALQIDELQPGLHTWSFTVLCNLLAVTPLDV